MSLSAVLPRPSEFLLDPRLLENCIGKVARGNDAIDHEARIVDRTLPNFVIAFALTYQRAAMRGQTRLNQPDESARHQAAMARVVS